MENILPLVLTPAAVIAVVIWNARSLNRSIQDLRTEMNQRFDKVDRRFEQVDRRFERVDDQQDQSRKEVNERFDGFRANMDQQFHSVNQRQDQFRAEVNEQSDAASRQNAELGRRIAKLEGSFESFLAFWRNRNAA